MKKINLSVILIPLLCSAVYATQPAHYAVPPAPKPMAVPPKMKQVVPKPIPMAVPPLAPKPVAKPAKKYKGFKPHKAQSPHYAVPPAPKPMAVPPKMKQVVPKPIPMAVPPLAPKPVAKPAKKYKGFKPHKAHTPHYAVPPAPKPMAVPHPVPQKVPHMRPMAVPPLAPKAPHGLTIHKAYKPGKKYKGFKPHHATTPKQHHGAKPVVMHSHKNVHKSVHPAVARQHPVKHVTVHPVAKPAQKHHINKGKTLYHKKHTAPTKHTAIDPMASKVQVAPMGAKKPVHHKVKKSLHAKTRRAASHVIAKPVGHANVYLNKGNGADTINIFGTSGNGFGTTGSKAKYNPKTGTWSFKVGWSGGKGTPQTFVLAHPDGHNSHGYSTGLTNIFVYKVPDGTNIIKDPYIVHSLGLPTNFIGKHQYQLTAHPVPAPINTKTVIVKPGPQQKNTVGTFHKTGTIPQFSKTPAQKGLSNAVSVKPTGVSAHKTVIVKPTMTHKTQVTATKTTTLPNTMGTPVKALTPHMTSTKPQGVAHKTVIVKPGTLQQSSVGTFHKTGTIPQFSKTPAQKGLSNAVSVKPTGVSAHKSVTVKPTMTHKTQVTPTKTTTLPKTMGTPVKVLTPHMTSTKPQGVTALKIPKSSKGTPGTSAKQSKTHMTSKQQHKAQVSKLHNANKVKSPTSRYKAKTTTPPMPVPTQMIPQTVPHSYNNPTATGMKPSIPQKVPNAIPVKGSIPGATPTKGAVPKPIAVPVKVPPVPAVPNLHPQMQAGTVVHNKHGKPIGTVVKLPNGKMGVQPLKSMLQPVKVPAKPSVPVKHPAKIAVPNLHPQMQAGTIVHNKHGKPIGTVVKLPNGKMGVQPLNPIAVPVKVPPVPKVPNKIPTLPKVPTVQPAVKPVLQPVKQTGQTKPMVHPTPSVQGTPTVNPAKLKGPTPSKPGTVNGVKQVTPTVFPKKQTGQAPAISPHGGNAKPMVHPTPSKPGTVNGVKQVTPTVFPTKQKGQAPAISPHGGNAKPTVKPGTVVHNAKGQPIGTVVTLPNGKQGIKPIAVPGAIPQKPAGMKNTHQKPSIQLPVGTVVHGKNGAPIGKIGLANGKKVLQPLSVPSATPGQKPTVFPKKQTGQAPAISPHGGNAKPMVHPTPSKPGTVNGVKQVTPTVFPSKQKGQAPAISPHGGNAIPTVKPGTVVHNAKGQPIGTVVTLPNGKQGIKPIAVPGAIPQKPAGMKNTHQKPTIQLPVGTVVHGKNGAPIGKIGLANGKKVLQPLSIPSATPGQKPTVFPKKQTGQAPAISPHGGNAKPMVHPTPSKPGTVNGVKQVTPTVFPKKQTGQAPAISPQGGNAKPMVHPTPSKPGTVNGVKQVTPTVFPTKQKGQAPAISPHGGNAIPTVKPGTVVHNAKGQPIGTVVTLPNGKQGIKPIAVPGAIPQKPAGMKNTHQKPTIQLPVGTVVHGKNGAPIGTIAQLPNGTKVLKPIAVPGAIPQKPAGTTQVTPTVNPAKLKGPKPSKPGTVNGVKQVSGKVRPNTINGVKQAPTVTTVTTATTATTANGASRNSVSNETPGVPAKTDVSAAHNDNTDKIEKPGLLDKLKNYFRIDQEKVIEPGIRNKEVEAYRTDDAKEIIYKDGIKQDDKDIKLPIDHTK